MRLARLAALGAIALCLLLAGFTVPAAAAEQATAIGDEMHLVIKFKPGLSDFFKDQINRRYSGISIAKVVPLGVQVVKMPKGHTWASLLKLAMVVRSEVGVEYAEPDYIASASYQPNDPYFNNQWALAKLQAPAAWDFTQGSSDIKIAICDTGIDQDHADLRAKIAANYNVTSSLNADDKYGHGTHVAGIAAAATDNGLGVAGLGFKSSLMNVKVLSDSGSGYYSWIANGITWAADNGAKVINLSLTGTLDSTVLADAVSYAWSHGVVVVAAAGNSGNSKAVYPAYYPGSIAVAATDTNDGKASWSNYGSWVDVAAPGVNIYSTMPNHTNSSGTTDYGYMSGTSMASPCVAGLAALVWSTPYGTSNAAVRSRIETTSERIAGTGTYWQNGRVNAYQAVLPAAPPPPPPPPPSPPPASPQLAVAVTAPPTTNMSGFSVQAKVSNTGTATAAGVSATITLPSGIIGNDPVTRLLGDIAAGADASATWNVTAVSGTYTFKVDASATNAAAASGTAGVKVDLPPGQVTGLKAAGGAGHIDLSWDANPETDVSRYNIYRRTTATAYSLLSSPVINSYADSNLPADATFYYQVSAVDAAGSEGPRSAEVAGKTDPAAIKKMHIQSISLALQSFYSWKSAIATVTIVDEAGAPVSGATVTGRWSGVVSSSGSGVTGSTGQARITSAYTTATRGKVFTFTVDSAALAGWTYDSSANTANSGSVTVP